MTQEEIKEGLWNKTMRIREIVKKANDLCNDSKNDNKSTEDLCVMVAEWADKTMIDKACKWLENWNAYRVCLEGHKEWFIEQFRKAMEE